MAERRSLLVPIISITGGIGFSIAAVFAWRKAAATKQAIVDAVTSGGKFAVHPTGYWPFQAGLSASARKMEGAPVDRRKNPLYTVEDFFAGRSDHVSVAGDYEIFPYGQKILVNWFDKTLVGRVTDTGGHFHGAKKMYRVAGEEPLDFCVESSKTPVPKKGVFATIVAGDNFEKGRAVATGKFKGQTVAGIVDGYTTDDAEALARMIRSECATGSTAEKLAIGWVARNRANMCGLSVHDLLAPLGKYGPQGRDGARTFASTRQEATAESKAIANKVLGAPASQDPTGGAVDFWEPALQDRLVAQGQSGYTKTADEVRADHARDDLHVVKTVGDIELLGRRRA